MANELTTTTTDLAPGPQTLVSLAKSPSAWTTEGARAVRAAATETDIAGALLRLADELAPVPMDTAARREWGNALDERLRRLAVKIAPGMSAAQGREWREVMVDALSDLPALVALTAAKRAIHRPMQFMNEIEPVVREIAADLERQRREAIARLERMRGEIERAAHPAPALPAPFEPIDAAELAAIRERLAKAVPVSGKPEGHPFTARVEPTIDDYLAIGLSEDDAHAALAERERLLRRQPQAQSIGSMAIAAE